MSVFDDDWAAFGFILLGAIAYVVVPPFTAGHGYQRGATAALAPTLLSIPEAPAPAPGLAIRARF